MSIKYKQNVQFIFDALVSNYNLKGYPDLAKFLGVKYQTLMAWKKRGRIGDYAPFLDKCPGINLNCLESGEGDLFKGGKETATCKVNKMNKMLESNIKDFVQFPICDLVSDTNGKYNLEEIGVVDYLLFKTEWIKKYTYKGLDRLKFVIVRGDYMEPTFYRGDLVMVDTGEDRIDVNGIFVIQRNDVLDIRSIWRDSNSVVIRSHNSKYPDEKLSYFDAYDLKVIGRVIWYWKRL